MNYFEAIDIFWVFEVFLSFSEFGNNNCENVCFNATLSKTSDHLFLFFVCTKLFNSSETYFTIIELQLIFSDDCYIIYWHNFPALIKWIIWKMWQATYLQMNDTHTTQWSVELSVYTSYMCIKVVLEVMSVKDLQIPKRQI